MDLGNDFYLVRFQYGQNYLKVLHESPWFIGQNFFTIRLWEPKFWATADECKQTAIWARLPQLPLEFYEPSLLQKMGEMLGIVLKVDACTNDALRGQYARICVQVNVEKTLKTVIHIGPHL